MKHEVRGSQKPVPDHVENYLNDLQKLGLRQAEEYGWQIQFVRKNKRNKPLAVLGVSGKPINGTLIDDGTIETELRIAMRH